MKQTEMKVHVLTFFLIVIAGLVGGFMTWLAFAHEQWGFLVAAPLSLLSIVCAIIAHRRWSQGPSEGEGPTAGSRWIVLASVLLVAALWGSFVLNNALIEARYR